MIPEEIKELIEKYQARQISPQELKILFRWYNQRAAEAKPMDEADMHRRLQRIGDSLPGLESPKTPSNPWYKWVAAAILCLGLGLSIYTFRKQEAPVTLSIVADSSATAELLTSTGSAIPLNQVKEGDTLETAGVKLYKTADGYIAYQFQGEGEEGLEQYTIRTPVGAETKMLLPDGTKLWLNAASTLSFQKQWGEDTRTVYLKGEAYFDVSKQFNPQLASYVPFQVYSDGQLVEVLGTKFQIKSYADEPWNSTSLFEGSVKLQTLTADKHVDKAVILKPGQQGLVHRERREMDFKNISEGAPQSWRDGYFSFQGETLAQVCTQLARWYPVKFEIQPGIPQGEYHGDIPKAYSLNEVLQILIQQKMTYEIYNRDNQLLVKLNQ